MFLVLFAVVFATSSAPVFAISNQEIGELAKQYADPDSAEWQEFRKAWSDYFLDFMPTEDQPELLERLKVVPDENDVAGWHEFFDHGDPDLMYQELKKVSEELDLRNPNLSLEEKVSRLQNWEDFSYGPFGWGGGGREYNGYTYDCNTVTLGWMALYRVAGMPTANVILVTSKLHTEAFYFLNNEWRRVKGRTSWTESFGLDYDTVRDVIDPLYKANKTYVGGEAVATGWPQSIDDINEPWIDIKMEVIMGLLLQQPMAYPERTLTRGEVAKLVCNYLGIVPMRSEAPFSDVPSSHKYVRYIWAMNRTGIMGGDAAGTFRPDDTLSMQEFAVIASRMLAFGKTRLLEEYNNLGAKEALFGVVLDREIYQRELAKLEPYPDSQPKVFADAGQIAVWAKSAVDEFSRFGILQGDNNGRLNPTVALDKTRFLVFMAKFEDRLGLFAYGDDGLSYTGDAFPLF
jgi:hypothetical protein